MAQELVIIALKNGINRHRPPAELILHSDRGGQYFGAKFKQLVDKHFFKQSMAGKKSVYENAYADRAGGPVNLGHYQARNVRKRGF